MSEPDLSAKLERALVALMGARTLDDAASRAEVGQLTLRRWLQQDPFQAAVDVDLLMGLRAHNGPLNFLSAGSPLFQPRG